MNLANEQLNELSVLSDVECSRSVLKIKVRSAKYIVLTLGQPTPRTIGLSLQPLQLGPVSLSQHFCCNVLNVVCCK